MSYKFIIKCTLITLILLVSYNTKSFALGSWAPGPNMGMTRDYTALATLPDGRVIATGGWDGSSYLNSTQIYDPTTNTWSAGPPMNGARYGHIAVKLLDGKILVAGGSDSGGMLRSVEIYDPTTNTWSTAANMGTRRWAAAAAVLTDGRVMVAGGSPDGSFSTNTTEIYNPSTNTWSAGPNLLEWIRLFGGATLPDGKIMVTGGFPDGPALISTEIYDPIANSWSYGTSMQSSRRSHAAVALADGRIYVTGGSVGLVYSEVYDPSTDTWSTEADPTTGGYGPSLTLLNDGRVMIAGGGSTNGAVSIGSFAQPVPSPTTPTAADIANNNDGRDIRVTFSGASNETNIASYRIFVVPSASAGTFTRSTASGLAAARYVVEAKNGNNGAHTVTLTQPLLDSNGAAISNGNTYKMFVLAVAQNGYTDTLSSGSGDLTLSMGNAPIASQALISDVANNGDGRDIKVVFRGASNETNISGYRIFVVPSASAGSFTANTASGLAVARYVAESKNGARISHSVTLTQPLLDSAGNVIAAGTPYKVFVLSIGQNGYGNSLSTASSALALAGSGSVTQLTQPAVPRASDIANNGDGRDLRVSFVSLPNEINVTEYRIVVVPSASAGTFDKTAANGLAAARYLVEAKTGPRRTHTVTLNNTLLDSAGNAIANGTAYRIFLLAVAASGNSDNSLSAQSALLTLLATVPAVSSVTNIQVSDVGSSNNASDIQVKFTSVYSETNVASYRIFVVPSASVGAFDLTAANSNTNYQIEAKSTARTQHTVALGSGLLDSDGGAVSNGNTYKVFVLTVGQNGYANKLSAGGASLSLN